jgi:hypothetical protein
LHPNDAGILVPLLVESLRKNGCLHQVSVTYNYICTDRFERTAEIVIPVQLIQSFCDRNQALHLLMRKPTCNSMTCPVHNPPLELIPSVLHLTKSMSSSVRNELFLGLLVDNHSIGPHHSGKRIMKIG